MHGHRTLDNLLEHWQPNMLASLRAAGYHVAIAGDRGDVFAPGVTEASTDFCGCVTRPAEWPVAKQQEREIAQGLQWSPWPYPLKFLRARGNLSVRARAHATDNAGGDQR